MSQLGGIRTSRKRWYAPVAVAGLIVSGLAGLGFTAASGAAAVTRPASQPAPNCGATIYKSPGVPWTCTFDDEFNGTTLDTTKWTVQQTANSGYTTGTGAGTACYVNSPNNVSVSGGTLNLTVRKEAAPFVCSYFVTQYTSGMVTTTNNFAQAYGLYEISAKLPATTLQGLQETFWLWPQNQNEYGSVWPDSGEIDFAEFYSVINSYDIPYIHYNAAKTDPNVTAYTCVISNPNAFHTYGLEWTPTSLTVLYDGKTCLVDHWTPAFPESGSEPFNQPFFIAITQALGVYPNAFVAGYTPLPATTSVDWVRAWK